MQRRASIGIEAPEVRVEVDLARGLPSFTIVGMPATSVREARDRVKSAILNVGLEFPAATRIIVNLAPAEIPKQGARFDLAIAVGILAASDQIDADQLAKFEFYGEPVLADNLTSRLVFLRFLRRLRLTPTHCQSALQWQPQSSFGVSVRACA